MWPSGASLKAFHENAGLDQLEVAAEALSSLANDVLNLLETHVKVIIISANESHNERHKTEFKSKLSN